MLDYLLPIPYHTPTAAFPVWVGRCRPSDPFLKRGAWIISSSSTHSCASFSVRGLPPNNLILVCNSHRSKLRNCSP